MADRATPSSKIKRELQQLRTELAAREAEADWLQAHYGRHLREALARMDALRAAKPEPAPPPPPPSVDEGEVQRLSQEVERLSQAETRYLDRIEELKDDLRAVGRGPMDAKR